MSILRKLFGSKPSPDSQNAPSQESAKSTADAPSRRPKQQLIFKLVAQALYHSAPPIDASRFAAELARFLPASRVLSHDDSLILISHDDLPLPVPEGKGPRPGAQTAIMMPNADGLPPSIESALEQTWDWTGARAAVEQSKRAVLITEMLCPHLTMADRMRVFHGVICALIATVPPHAVYSLSADRLIEPSRVLKPIPADMNAYELPLFVNVRFVRILNTDPEQYLLDTRGLAELLLPDLQIHCTGLEPGMLASLLYNLAGYVLANGDCIQDGHTVQGLEPTQRWKCRHEEALNDPPREVLDINPGPPHAAGNRSER